MPDSLVSWWQVDLSQAEAVAGVFRLVKPRIVFHLASHVSGDRRLEAVWPTVRDNLLSTVNLLTAASETGGPRVVLAGSMEESDLDEANGVPVSPYAAAKTAASTYARMFNGLYGLPVVNLRIFMVYGPGQLDASKLIPYVTTSLLRGEEPRLSSGHREIDWVFVDDVVAALLAAAQAPDAAGQTIDVGSGELITVRALVEHLAGLVGGSTKPRWKIARSSIGGSPTSSGQQRSSAGSRNCPWQTDWSKPSGGFAHVTKRSSDEPSRTARQHWVARLQRRALCGSSDRVVARSGLPRL
jgi:nucleoside-diphosphate-sugar epimerase